MTTKAKIFYYSDFQLDKSILLEEVSKLPEKIDECQLEEFIELIRLTYGVEASDRDFKEGRFYTHEQVVEMSKR